MNTDNQKNESEFEVFMERQLVDELDYSLSPADGIEAIDNVFGDLPKVHRSREKRCGRRRKSLRIYTARLDWYPLGFTYVQIGSRLHVLEVWEDRTLGRPGREEVDSVIGIQGE